MNTDERINRLIERGKAVLHSRNRNTSVAGLPTLDVAMFNTWRTQTLSCLEELLPSSSPYIIEFDKKIKRAVSDQVQTGIGILNSVLEDLQEGHISPVQDSSVKNQPVELIRNLCTKFPLVARQLRYRHNGRPAFDIEDEYDVQDLFHALLLQHFDDVRAEEGTPSSAGSASRMDFLLKNEKIVIEVKKTRNGLEDRELGKQLINDIAKYKSHPECRALICFVYDPEAFIRNPRGIENDLYSQSDDLYVEILIRPTV